jgi:hypothetical protein
VQFNSSNAFAGSSNMVFDGTNLDVAGLKLGGTAVTATAAELNILAGGIGVITDFDPSWTNLTEGNGSYDYKAFLQINNLIVVSVSFTFGSTSAMSTNPSFTVPVAVAETNQIVTGEGLAVEDGGSNYPLLVNMTSSELVIYDQAVVSNKVIRSAVTSGSPFTWGTGDKIQVTATYFTGTPS